MIIKHLSRRSGQRAVLYAGTLLRMKPKQIFYRIAGYFGIKATIGCRVMNYSSHVFPIKPIPELDFDPVFLRRFSPDDLLNNRFSFLHAEHEIDIDHLWECRDDTPLWNFNLHYFEFLFPLVQASGDSGNKVYLDKAFSFITSWIHHNPIKGKGPGWAPYTIDLRLTNWLSFFTYAEKEMSDDFRSLFIHSIYDQYAYLACHVEKDTLGNHYFEDLKTLVLCAIFFNDEKVLHKVLRDLYKECREEILKDGMHFELSPMYHNLILESLMKTAYALRGSGYPDHVLEACVQPMVDAAWSMGESLERIPLFNDSGDNVAKSLSSLIQAAEYFGVKPCFKTSFPYAGYYIFKKEDWKLIIDAGQPGPSYIPGHAHCDALSFELYYKGKPAAVNCGTYAYQSEKRKFFRGTSAHNTLMINGREQSLCWGFFRMAGRSKVRVLSVDDKHLKARIRDYSGRIAIRRFDIGNDLVITDTAKGSDLTAWFHPLINLEPSYTCEQVHEEKQPYAPEYGICREISAVSYKGRKRLKLRIRLE